jgi:Peptidase MA superfamily
LPVWFNEGLASLVELYSDPDYPRLLQNAYESGELLPIATLCQSFPSDPQNSRLAYAESAFFTKYLYDQFGPTGLNRLMAAYSGGIECQLAVRRALGTDLPRLEGRWQQAEFAEQAVQTTLNEYFPWIILLGIILVGPLLLMVLIIRQRSSRVDL